MYNICNVNSVIKKLEMQRMFDRDMLYNDVISEDGDSLSGGQIKIIAFARALYGDYKIILLDEVSSNMDKISADIIKDTLKVWKEDKIVIMIDHTEFYDEIADNVLLLN
ncbi:ATP-binding cassette domain-containing protein [Anaerosacchariphilus polymeriproducens]|uniref:ATP-binding cassette domain-containing protein n=1 Tax=Anaerosacchariphilus polymeriproducens TaxID=1812858 RepID=A0A371B059_9FIRM|nr:ATP-binding cassette domain-containing protein [Anaerosacchariphilus polymeriproducens]RDU25191.1 ATP-binding cassette domain-containing protein [Anaerosacchariphilus polymeriproducens]